MAFQSKRFAQPSFQSVSHHCTAMLFGDAESDPRLVEFIPSNEHQQDTISPLAL